MDGRLGLGLVEYRGAERKIVRRRQGDAMDVGAVVGGGAVLVLRSVPMLPWGKAVLMTVIPIRSHHLVLGGNRGALMMD